jgi:hypothetical protein
MFKKVRDPGFTERFICRTCTVPNHLGNDGRPVIFNQDHLESVLKIKRLGVKQASVGRAAG